MIFGTNRTKISDVMRHGLSKNKLIMWTRLQLLTFQMDEFYNELKGRFYV